MPTPYDPEDFPPLAVTVAAPATATVQEVHQVAVHLLCAAVDLQVGADHSTSAYEPYPAVHS